MENCIFCKIIRNEVPAHKVWEDQKFLAFLDINPVNVGHLLIIPKKHVSYIFDLEEPDYSEIFRQAKFLAKPLQQITKAKRIGVAIEGFGVDHIHVHLVPVNNAGELDPNRAKTASPDELVAMAESVKNLIAIK